MKNNLLIKGILVFLVIALLAIGFTGCAPTTGSVVITIGGNYTSYNYNVYLDSWYNKIGVTSWGTFTATNVTPGWHTFYVDDVIWEYYYDYGTVYVTAGQTSYLTLYPY